MSTQFMGPGLRPISDYIINSVAPSTWAGYQSAWFLYLKFLNLIHEPMGSFSESLILQFLSFLFAQRYSWSYVQKTLSGISFFLKINNMPSCMQYFLVKQALKGYKRDNFRSDSRKPITPKVLSELCSVTGKVCFSAFESKLFQAVFSIIFFAALRVSELVSIQTSDILIFKNSLRILINKSKTDQLGRGSWIQLENCVSWHICPVFLVNQYTLVRPAGGKKFFIHESGLPLTKYQFICVLKKCLKVLNLDQDQLTFSFI